MQQVQLSRPSGVYWGVRKSLRTDEPAI
jgi:hypothetical protein